MNFLYRYVFLLIDEYERLQLGRTARAFSESVFLRFRGLAWMLGCSHQKLRTRDRVYHAMLSRGFNGRIVIEKETPLTSRTSEYLLCASVSGVGKYIGVIYG
jgi:energy-coupling factor transporter transmembrane protein EcfT